MLYRTDCPLLKKHLTAISVIIAHMTRTLVRHYGVKYATELGIGPMQPNQKGNVSQGETKRK
jgi:hypothetical protein